MQGYPASPPSPLFGIMSWGFSFLIIYSFVRLSSEGTDRFTGCIKATIVGIISTIIVVLLESLNTWNWFQRFQSTFMNLSTILTVALMLSLPFILIPIFDLTIQQYHLKKS